MKKLFDPLFISYCVIWIVIHSCRRLGAPIPWLNGQLTDFIAVPVIAHLALTFTRTVVLRDSQYTYPLRYLLFIALYTTVVFELLMPAFSPKYTADILDAIAYGCGALFYHFVHQRFYNV